MHIVLIGMSNIGKSHWAARLEREAGFARIDCDARVEQRLGAELTRLGYAGLRDIARWMGQPCDPQYPEASRKYIACERDVMREIVETLRTAPADMPRVVDTTGSVIYLDDALLAQLQSLGRVVYLEASHGHVAEMFQRYLAEPKPVIWGDSYAPHAGEAPKAALARCYPDLLEFRARRYRQLAQVTIPFERHRSPDALAEILGGQPPAARSSGG